MSLLTKPSRAFGAASLSAVLALVLSGCFLIDANAEFLDAVQEGLGSEQSEGEFPDEGAGADDVPSRGEQLATPEELDVFDFAVGDCFLELDEDGSGNEVSSGAEVPCTEPHVYEVYYSETLAVSDFSEVDFAADELCFQNYEAFTGFPFDYTALDYFVLMPTLESFNTGDREVDCLIHRSDMALVEESLRGKGPDFWMEASRVVQLGECWSSTTDSQSGDVYPSEIVPCEGPHVFEVYHIDYLSDGLEFPLQEPVDDLCEAGFEPFIGVPYSDSVYYFFWYAPNEDTYGAGDRRVACLVTTSDFAPVRGTLEGIAR